MEWKPNWTGIYLKGPEVVVVVLMMKSQVDMRLSTVEKGCLHVVADMAME